ncbi:MAG: hypothetical protein JOZ41_20450 [Chloroflexi bacterium]|nr:hypothetical protein [Chloroflexota bacterium]
MSLGVLALAGAIVWLALTTSAPAPPDRLTQAALAYSQQYIEWSRGPTVRSSQTVPLARLDGALARNVPPRVRRDVNVSDLLRRFGPRRRLGLVVLYGVYNSLPPDEGVEVNGDLAVLVDVATNRVLLVTG